MDLILGERTNKSARVGNAGPCGHHDVKGMRDRLSEQRTIAMSAKNVGRKFGRGGMKGDGMLWKRFSKAKNAFVMRCVGLQHLAQPRIFAHPSARELSLHTLYQRGRDGMARRARDARGVEAKRGRERCKSQITEGVTVARMTLVSPGTVAPPAPPRTHLRVFFPPWLRGSFRAAGPCRSRRSPGPRRARRPRSRRCASLTGPLVVRRILGPDEILQIHPPTTNAGSTVLSLRKTGNHLHHPPRQEVTPSTLEYVCTH